MFTIAHLAQALTSVLAMLVCLTFHEAAHAFVARLRGDRTAQDLGRLSLNPLVHADPLGTLILPALGAFFQMPIIGWARPVPVDPRYFKNPKWDHVLVSLAGPFSNLLFSFVCTGLLLFYQSRWQATIPEGHFLFPFVKLLGAMVYINAILAFFNLIPLPPLDGAAVLRILLPDDVAQAYEEKVTPYSFFILLALLMAGGLNWMGKLSLLFVNLSGSLLSAIFSF